MEWRSVLDADMVGADNPAALDKIDLAQSLGLIGEGLAYCVECAEGLAIVRLTKEGKAQCVAIAPNGALNEGPIAESELFSRPWPGDWKTKRNAGRTIPQDAEGYRLGGFACGIMEGRGVVLALVTGLDSSGGLATVQTMPEGPEIDPRTHKARKWWPFHRWQDGARLLWYRQGGRIVHNYRLACIQASNLDRRAKGLPAKNVRKKRKAPKKALERAELHLYTQNKPGNGAGLLGVCHHVKS